MSVAKVSRHTSSEPGALARRQPRITTNASAGAKGKSTKTVKTTGGLCAYASGPNACGAETSSYSLCMHKMSEG